MIKDKNNKYLTTHKMAPLALFVYNRPLHTAKSIEALAKNAESRLSDLFIFSDGAKTKQDLQNVLEVRKIIKNIKGFQSVTIIEYKKNLGLAMSTIKGISYLCNKYKRVIVIEDDNIVCQTFLHFMNKALNIYQKYKKVMAISGYTIPILDPTVLPETFCFPYASTWGWGTWERAWKLFEPNANKLLIKISDKKVKNKISVEGGMDFSHKLRQQISGEIDSWSIKWYLSILLNNGLCLYHNKSLVKNIGFDGSGIHCKISNFFDTIQTDNPVKYFTRSIKIPREAYRLFFDFYKNAELQKN